MNTTKVLIADDHEVVAQGLSALITLQAGMKVVACVQDGREAVRQSIEWRPDIVLIDHSMPIMNGTEATRMIHDRCPKTRIIMLSMHSDRVHVLRALKAGASGYVLKQSAARVVVEAIGVVRSGRRYLSRELADSVIDYVSGKEPAGVSAEILSQRERQVLQMLAEGRPVTEIATTLALSPKTVETYRARMMDKLKIRDFAGLVKFAIREGITSLD